MVKEYECGSIINNLEEILPILEKNSKINFDRSKVDTSQMCEKYLKLYIEIMNKER